MNGWNLDEFDELNDVFGDIYDAKYEIENCIRGCYTNCSTYEELADYLDELGDRLQTASSYLRHKKEEQEESED